MWEGFAAPDDSAHLLSSFVSPPWTLHSDKVLGPVKRRETSRWCVLSLLLATPIKVNCIRDCVFAGAVVWTSRKRRCDSAKCVRTDEQPNNTAAVHRRLNRNCKKTWSSCPTQSALCTTRSRSTQSQQPPRRISPAEIFVGLPPFEELENSLPITPSFLLLVVVVARYLF